MEKLGCASLAYSGFLESQDLEDPLLGSSIERKAIKEDFWTHAQLTIKATSTVWLKWIFITLKESTGSQRSLWKAKQCWGPYPQHLWSNIYVQVLNQDRIEFNLS